ncbi:MAG: SpoIID/LytB domain-containing protein [Elusimicrobia bacterium]|nr:SpoIID/LytB domain-containing protein [Elusimicrobiota bacterium]
MRHSAKKTISVPIAGLLGTFLLSGFVGAKEPTCLESGSNLFRSGRLTQAAEVFSSKDCLSSAGVSAYLNAGIVYRDLGKDREAFALFEKAATLAPKDPDAQASYGSAALRARMPERAQAAFQAALSIDRAHPWALLGLGKLELQKKKPDEAVQLLEKLTTLRPALSLGWLYLARAYEATGESQKAEEAYRKTYKTDWTFFEARLPLANLYKRMGRFYQAWRQYAKVLLLDPRHQQAGRNEEALGRRVGRSAEDVVPKLTLAELKVPHPSADRRKMPLIRVGIGTSALGRPVFRKALALRCTGPFRVIDPETGRRLKEGLAEEDFLIHAVGGGWFQVSDSSHERLLRFKRAVAVEPVDQDRHTLVLREVRVASGYSWSAVRDRQFKGRIEVRARGGKLYAINTLALEDYLYGVVTEEMPKNFPAEAHKVQAVIARTHALYLTRHVGRHRRDGYDVCDGQNCQVYAGMAGENPQARSAADATRGLVLRYKGRLAHTIFTSNCGGHTQDSGELQGWTRLPYLKGRLDGDADVSAPRTPWELERWVKGIPSVYCSVAEKIGPTQFRWTRAVPAKELERRANRIRPIGPIKRVLVVLRSLSGNANEVWIDGSRGRLKVRREHKIRNLLGLASLRSTLFTVETERDLSGRPVEFVFYGGGWGHGVGLCQYGAAGRAMKGQDYRRILGHYYPGTSLGRSDY